MLKKLLVAFLIIAVLGMAALGAGSYFLYRTAAPLIEDARNYARGLSELGKLEADVKNKAPHTAPASGELSEAQVQRFARVQEHVSTALGQRMRDFEQKYRHLTSGGNNAHASVREVFDSVRELAGVFVEARRYQVDALNQENFSQEEYSWVRNRMFEAAGMEVANRIDLRSLERAIRDGTGINDFQAPTVPKLAVPEKNVALVKPYMRQLDDWIPLAFFGL
jgi:hypothetical protein